MEYVLLAALILLYLRYFSPIVVRWRLRMPSALKPARVVGQANSFVLFAAEDVQIPTDQWRLVATGVEFLPFPGIMLKSVGYRISFFGQVDYALEAVAASQGRRLLGRLAPCGDFGEAVVLHNHNQKYFIKIKAGDEIGIITFYRTPFVFLRQR